MATRRVRRPYRWLRRGLLVILLLLLAGVGGLYWFGRQQRQPPPRRPTPLNAEEPTVQEATVVGRGFEYTHFEAGRKRFTLRALRTVEDREATVFLEGVDMIVYEKEGEGYEMSADRARYNRERQEALLQGNVRLRSGGRGLSLSAESLNLGREGRLLTSDQPVEIVYAEAYRATGQRFRVHLPEDLFLLTGDVRVDEIPGKAPPFSLRCSRLQLERLRSLLRADGGVEVQQPGRRVVAESVNAFLTEDLSSIRFLRARWKVAGRIELEDATTVAFTGRSLSTLLREDGSAPQSAELEGSPTEPATIRSEDASGAVRTISAGYLTSEFRPGGGQWVEAFGDPEIVEEAGPGEAQADAPLAGPPTAGRRLRGGRGSAEILPGGGLGEVRLVEGVEYRAEGLHVQGESGRFDVAAGRGEFYGAEAEEGPEAATAEGEAPEVPPREPLPRVVVVSPRGRMVAPVVSYVREDGLLQGRGGVSTEIREGLSLMGGGGPGARDSEAAGPTRVESREAFWRQEPRGALFRGDVRAWQGENVVLAEWLRADPEEGKLTAGGGVRTVAVPESTPERPDPGPLTVTAELLTWMQREGQEAGAQHGSQRGGELIYEHDVQAEADGRKIACERLEVTVGDNRQPERLVALEDVRLEDPATGKTARANRADWLPESRKVALFGQPAVVTDARGTEVKASELTYELDTGRVRAGTALAPAPPATAPPETTPPATAPPATTSRTPTSTQGER